MKNNSVFMGDEVNRLLSVVEESIIHSPITVDDIMDCVKVMAELSGYGINIKPILDKYLKNIKESKDVENK